MSLYRAYVAFNKYLSSLTNNQMIMCW